MLNLNISIWLSHMDGSWNMGETMNCRDMSTENKWSFSTTKRITKNRCLQSGCGVWLCLVKQAKIANPNDVQKQPTYENTVNSHRNFIFSPILESFSPGTNHLWSDKLTISSPTTGLITIWSQWQNINNILYNLCFQLGLHSFGSLMQWCNGSFSSI